MAFSEMGAFMLDGRLSVLTNSRIASRRNSQMGRLELLPPVSGVIRMLDRGSSQHNLYDTTSYRLSSHQQTDCRPHHTRPNIPTRAEYISIASPCRPCAGPCTPLYLSSVVRGHNREGSVLERYILPPWHDPACDAARPTRVHDRRPPPYIRKECGLRRKITGQHQRRSPPQQTVSPGNQSPASCASSKLPSKRSEVLFPNAGQLGVVDRNRSLC